MRHLEVGGLAVFYGDFFSQQSLVKLGRKLSLMVREHDISVFLVNLGSRTVITCGKKTARFGNLCSLLLVFIEILFQRLCALNRWQHGTPGVIQRLNLSLNSAYPLG